MKKSILLSAVCVFVLSGSSIAQKISGKLIFKKGQEFEINTDIKTTLSQQAMGQAIDVTTSGSVVHLYKVTNVSTGATSLHHEVKKINISIDGMGKKMTFNSDNPKDMSNPMGKKIKSMLDKTFDMVIDQNGKIVSVTTNGVDSLETDPQMMMMASMLNSILGIIEAPQKDDPSFFQILPPAGAAVGETWSKSDNSDSQQSTATYKLSGANASAITIDFSETSTLKTKAEMMGMETTTTLNNKTSGKITLDKSSNVIRQKTSTTDSNGNTEVMGTTIPITSKTSITITVKSKN